MIRDKREMLPRHAYRRAQRRHTPSRVPGDILSIRAGASVLFAARTPRATISHATTINALAPANVPQAHSPANLCGGRHSSARSLTCAQRIETARPGQHSFMAFMAERQIASEVIRLEMVPEEGVEPTRYQVPLDFESSASASSATPGNTFKIAWALALLKARSRSCIDLQGFPQGSGWTRP